MGEGFAAQQRLDSVLRRSTLVGQHDGRAYPDRLRGNLAWLQAIPTTRLCNRHSSALNSRCRLDVRATRGPYLHCEVARLNVARLDGSDRLPFTGSAIDPAESHAR